MPFHEVVQGEDVKQIAFERAGMRRPAPVLEHGSNSNLLAHRNPNVLRPGDRIFIPESARRDEGADTGSRHRFRRVGQRELRLRLHTPDGEPMRKAAYQINVNGTWREGETDDTGLLRQPLPLTRCDVILRADGVDVKLLVAHLNPVETVTGQQARLNNLGFFSGPVDGIVGPRTRAATRAFQKSRGITDDGIIGPVTRAHLVDAFGC
ncbi:MAG: peptidoglycan-binding protein [Phycisphaerales bacterium]|nr:peptidoglycan-binding protein [Phycisphaerales bacterium]